jgi:hypothetical protein
MPVYVEMEDEGVAFWFHELAARVFATKYRGRISRSLLARFVKDSRRVGGSDTIRVAWSTRQTGQAPFSVRAFKASADSFTVRPFSPPLIRSHRDAIQAARKYRYSL